MKSTFFSTAVCLLLFYTDLYSQTLGAQGGPRGQANSDQHRNFKSNSNSQPGALNPEAVKKIRSVKIEVKKQQLEFVAPKQRPKGLLLTEEDPYNSDVAAFQATYLVRAPRGFKPGFRYVDSFAMNNKIHIQGLVPESVKVEEVLIKHRSEARGYQFVINPKLQALVIAKYSVPMPSDDLSFVSYFLGLDLKGHKFNKIRVKINNHELPGWKALLTLQDKSKVEMIGLQLDVDRFLFKIGKDMGENKKFVDDFLVQLVDVKQLNADQDIVEHLLDPTTRESEKPIVENCRIANIPINAEIHAIAIKQGSKVLRQSVDSTFKEGFEEFVDVGFSEKPVFLILSAATPTLWRLRFTPSAKISGILISGKGRQVFAEKEPTIPIYYSPKVEQKKGFPQCPEMYIEGPKDRLGALKMGDSLAAVIGRRKIQSVQLKRSKGFFKIGVIDIELPIHPD